MLSKSWVAVETESQKGERKKKVVASMLKADLTSTQLLFVTKWQRFAYLLARSPGATLTKAQLTIRKRELWYHHRSGGVLRRSKKHFMEVQFHGS